MSDNKNNRDWKYYFGIQFMKGIIVLLIIAFALFTEYVYPLNAISITVFLVIIFILMFISEKLGKKNK